MTSAQLMLFYFASVTGVLAMVSPMISNTVARFVFGTVLGIIATTSWPAAKLAFG